MWTLLDSRAGIEARISAVVGTSFAWFPTFDLSPFPVGAQVLLIDSTGKQRAGYISAVAPAGLTLGAERVPDPSCATDFFDSKGTGWSHDAVSGEYDNDGSQVGYSSLSENNVFVLQQLYVGQFTIRNRTAGYLNMWFGNNTPGGAKSANGTFTVYRTSTSNAQLQMEASEDFVGSTDDISVKQVTVPPATAALIVCAPGGLTEAWYGDPAFNFNAVTDVLIQQWVDEVGPGRFRTRRYDRRRRT